MRAGQIRQDAAGSDRKLTTAVRAPVATIRLMTLHAYSRVPQQERSRLSFDRVLDGATRLLEENGYEGFNITDVSRISKVSIGSIYARVDSKEDLLRAVQDRVLTQVDADHLRWTDPELW
jgi:hypothetical protein